MDELQATTSCRPRFRVGNSPASNQDSRQPDSVNLMAMFEFGGATTFDF